MGKETAMQIHPLISAVIAATTLTACDPYTNSGFFLYEIDAWSVDGAQVTHTRFVDDVRLAGLPKDAAWRLSYARFLQLADEEGATRDAIKFSGATLSAPESAAPWPTLWAGEFELWAKTRSGPAQLLGTTTLVPAVEDGGALRFDELDLDLRSVSDDFETGAFDIVLKGTPAVPVDTLPDLELLVSFDSEAHRGP